MVLWMFVSLVSCFDSLLDRGRSMLNCTALKSPAMAILWLFLRLSLIVFLIHLEIVIIVSSPGPSRAALGPDTA